MVKERKSFADVDIFNKAYLVYSADTDIPNKDFRYGERRTIVLRNVETGQLEKINYRLSGALKSHHPDEYAFIFGQVESDDYPGCLVFNFNEDGSLGKITLSFCGKSPNVVEFTEMTKGIKYPAEVTAIDPFRSKFTSPAL